MTYYQNESSNSVPSGSAEAADEETALIAGKSLPQRKKRMMNPSQLLAVIVGCCCGCCVVLFVGLQNKGFDSLAAATAIAWPFGNAKPPAMAAAPPAAPFDWVKFKADVKTYWAGEKL